MIEIVLWLMAIQAVIGAFDVIYNHEFDAKLPFQHSALPELRIHVIRAILYAGVFAGLAWFAWHGIYAWLFVTIILIEIGLTLWDFVIEDQTRKLSPLERITHTVLAMNGGAYVGFLGYVIWTDWRLQPDALVWQNYGALSGFLIAAAIGVFLSGLRDIVAIIMLRRMARIR